LVDHAPAVAAKMATIMLRFEDVLAQRFAKEAGVDPKTDFYGQMQAALLVAGNRRVAQRWRESHGKVSLALELGNVVDWTIKNFPPRQRASNKSR
jgi:hypothetical protein